MSEPAPEALGDPEALVEVVEAVEAIDPTPPSGFLARSRWICLSSVSNFGRQASPP